MPSDTSSFPLVTKEYTEWWAKSWKTSLGANTKLSLKLGHTIQRAPAKDPKEPYVSSSIGKGNITQAAETSTRKRRIPLDKVASNPAFEAVHGEGNEIISALLPSNDESSNQCPSKETSKLSDFEEGVRLTSQVSLGSVNEANFLGLHETGATSRPQDKRQKQLLLQWRGFLPNNNKRQFCPFPQSRRHMLRSPSFLLRSSKVKPKEYF
ncbi:hypothetical protein ACP275_04G135500 [Erythranthe tilingii]